MISFPKVRIHHALATGLLAATYRLYRDKHRVNFAYKAGILHLQRPAAFGLVIGIQKAEAADGSSFPLFLSPYLEGVFRIGQLGFVEIEGVEDQRFSFGQEDPAECLPSFTRRVGIPHINYVQLAGSHQVANILALGEQLAIKIKVPVGNAQLLRKIIDLDFHCHGRGLIFVTLLVQACQFGFGVPE